MSKKIARLFLPLILFLIPVLFAAGCGSQDDESAEPDAVPVRVEEVSAGAISETINFSGEVTAGSEVQVVPKTAGKIIRVAARVGDEVRQGDLLVELEAKELAVTVKQAEAAVEMARANLRSAQSGGTLAQLKAATEQAEANCTNTRANLQRIESLYLEGAVSLQQVEGARLQFKVAESQYNLAREQLELFERGEGQVEVLRAQVTQAEAGLEMAKLNYGNARITAPVNGVISSVNAEVGNMASPGTPVVTIVNVEGVTVSVMLTEQTIGMVARGLSVEVEIPSLGQNFQGEISDVAPSRLTGTKSYPVKVCILDAPGVKPGMFARLKLAVARSEDAVLMPRTALVEREGEYFIFSVKDGKAVRRAVAIGLENEQYAEILSGFAVGEEVIVAGQQYLQDGSPVFLEEEED